MKNGKKSYTLCAKTTSKCSLYTWAWIGSWCSDTQKVLKQDRTTLMILFLCQRSYAAYPLRKIRSIIRDNVFSLFIDFLQLM